MLTILKAYIQKPNPKYAFEAKIEEIYESLNVKEALAHPGWFQAMQEIGGVVCPRRRQNLRSS